MASLMEILDEMAATLQTAVGDGFQVTPRMNFNPTPPSIDIYPGDPFRDETAAGFGDDSGEVIVTVRARVTTADHQAGQDELLALIDEEHALSVAAALQDDQTLNGTATSVYVEGPTGYRQYTDSGSEGALLGVEWRVTVLRAPTPAGLSLNNTAKKEEVY